MKTPYKLVYRTIDGKQTTLGGFDCHDTKSAAGRLFQLKSVKSVKVVKRSNKRVFLRLCKDKYGNTLQYLFINVPSELAKSG